MPRKDIFHDALKNALIKEDWIITHDPYIVLRGSQALYIDIGAETPLAAEKNGRKIAVEIKSLLGRVDMPEFERALGQYVLYRSLLKRQEQDRALYLAVEEDAFNEYFDKAEGRDLLADEQIKLVVFLAINEVITSWIE
jgi:hypothetical protein